MKIKKLAKYITNSDYRFLVDVAHGKYRSLPDDIFLKRKYKAIFGKELNLECPTSFNEKLQWLKLYYRDPAYTVMVDKYLVRDYIAKTISEEVLIPLIDAWEDPHDIVFERLPNEFVLKCNHNSGLGMYICHDKSSINKKKVIQDLCKGLRQDYYSITKEWPYKNVKRKVICEKLIINENDAMEPLDDYKVMVFNGKVRIIEHHKGRFTNHYTQDFYDQDWNKLNLSQAIAGDPTSNSVSSKPAHLAEMIAYSERIAGNLPYLRVDWYDVNDTLYFGEITFFDGGGYVKWDTDEMDNYVGSLLNLEGCSLGDYR